MQGSGSCLGWRWLVGITLVASTSAVACSDGGGAAAPHDAGADVGGISAAPVVAAPDLRFKWVGAGFSIKAAGLTNAGPGASGTVGFRGQEFWSALEITGESASFYYSFKTVENLENMAGTATSGSLSVLGADLDGLEDPRGIVTSLDSGYFDLGSPSYVYNALLIRTESEAVAYQPFTRGSVAPDDLAAWAADNGKRGVVVTALCPQAVAADAGPDPGSLYVTAFGRKGDTATYETQVAITPFDGLAAQLDAMAAGGYILTALGRSRTEHDASDNFVAVGTRVAGQTSPRIIELVDVPCVVGSGNTAGRQELDALVARGFALVGYIFHAPSSACDGSPTWALIGER